jgi:hypothetical protein
MTTEEWQTCTHALIMLDAVSGRGCDQQLRAFACACARRLWHLLPAESRDALAVAEAYARQQASDRDLEPAHKLAEVGCRRVRQGTSFKKRKIRAQERAALVVLAATAPDPWGAARQAVLAHVDLVGTQPAELLREFLSYPLRDTADPGAGT